MNKRNVMYSEEETRRASHRAIDQAISEQLPALARACHYRMAQPLSADELEEAIQGACLVAWARRDSFKGESSLETWLYGIARICILKQRRNSARAAHRDLSALEPHLEAHGTRPGSRFDTGLQEAIKTSIEGAGATLARIVTLHDVEGLTFAQVGDRLSLSEAAAKQRYARGIQRVRRRLLPFWLVLRR